MPKRNKSVRRPPRRTAPPKKKRPTPKRATRIRRRGARRNAPKRRRPRKRTAREPRTAGAYFRLSAQTRDRWARVFHVLSDLRAGKPRRQAFRDAGLTPQAAHRLAPTAFRKLPNGRIVVRPTDRLLRVLYLPDDTAPGGKREVSTRDSHQAAVISEYWRAVRRFLRTGERTGLVMLRGRSVIASNGKSVPLLTDTSALRRLANAGVLTFESIYSR